MAAPIRVVHPGQHPLRHNASEFTYTSARIPGVTNIEDTLDYIVAVLYPNYIGTYDEPGDLPVLATANDYAIVSDDGDGKSAGYIYTSIDGVSGWSKRYDVDWSLEDILAETVNRTFPMYVSRDGFNQKDALGADKVGTYAGQTVFGGTSTNTNLTFNANSADGTGYVQTDNDFRPTADLSIDLGDLTHQFDKAYLGTAYLGTLTAAAGSITDSSGSISFDNENLSTTGTIGSGTHTISSDLALSTGSITSVSGAISFSNENLSTTGTIASGTHTVSTDLELATGSIKSVSGAISFDNENLLTTGTLGAGATTVTQLNADNLRLDANTISSTNVDGAIVIAANGTGVLDINSAMETLGQTVVGTIGVTGQLNVDNLRVDGNTLSSTDAGGNVVIDPNGAGLIEIGSAVFPTTDSAWDIGKSGNVWNDLWLDGNIKDGSSTLSVATLMTFNSIGAPNSGDTLFWSGTKWVASAPDTEIDHGTISGLSDDDHTQYVKVAGRAGGQSIQGGTADSNDLTLESTTSAVKGNVLTKDDLLPFTNASFAVSWSGVDLGDATHYFRDLYTKGELRGFRYENFTSATLPGASASAPGRTVFSTDNAKLYTDVGGSWVAVSASRYVSDTVWNGTDVTKTVDVSATIDDARNCTWQLHDNTNDFEIIYAGIKAISATQIRITTGSPLPAGSYRVTGFE